MPNGSPKAMLQGRTTHYSSKKICENVNNDLNFLHKIYVTLEGKLNVQV
jgi:hypothetical protein